MIRTVIGSLISIAMIGAFGMPAAGQTTSRDMLKCQKKLIAQASSLTRLSARKIQGCTDKVAKCKLASEIDGVDPTDCLAKAAIACAKVGPSLATAISKRQANMVKACGLIPLAELERFIAGLGFLDVSASCGSLSPPLSPIVVTDATSLIQCLLVTTECAVEREVFLRDPRAVDSLTEVGEAGTFPCTGA